MPKIIFDDGETREISADSSLVVLAPDGGVMLALLGVGSSRSHGNLIAALLVLANAPKPSASSCALASQLDALLEATEKLIEEQEG